MKIMVMKDPKALTKPHVILLNTPAIDTLFGIEPKLGFRDINRFSTWVVLILRDKRSQWFRWKAESCCVPSLMRQNKSLELKMELLDKKVDKGFFETRLTRKMVDKDLPAELVESGTFDADPPTGSPVRDKTAAIKTELARRDHQESVVEKEVAA